MTDPEALKAAGALTHDKDGNLLLHVHVQPNARRTELAGLHGNRLKIRLAAPPVDGKANKALLAFLTKIWTPKSDITLLRGQTTRQKTLKITPKS